MCTSYDLISNSINTGVHVIPIGTKVRVLRKTKGSSRSFGIGKIAIVKRIRFDKEYYLEFDDQDLESLNHKAGYIYAETDLEIFQLEIINGMI